MKSRDLRNALILLLCMSISGCVTMPNGKKKFDPWEAGIRTEKSIDTTLENMGEASNSNSDFYR